jgi:two-component system heavy metal sensor histidine kinase CusS
VGHAGGTHPASGRTRDHGVGRLECGGIEARIRETTEYASVLFHIDVHGKTVGTVFRSSNLHGETIPDVPGQRIFEAALPDKGQMRGDAARFPPLPPWPVTACA